MKKEYRYDSLRYMLGVSIPTFLASILSIYSVYQYYTGGKNKFYLFLFITCTMIAIDHFFALTHPKVIVDNEEKIQLYSFGREHTYVWNDIEKINVRKAAFTNKIYLRLGNTSFFKGRYWINIDLFNDGNELLEILKDHEAKLHPMMDRFNRRSTRRINKNNAR